MIQICFSYYPRQNICKFFIFPWPIIFVYWITQQGNTCPKSTIKTLEKGVKYVKEWRLWRRYGVFIVNFEYISHLFLVFLLLTLNK